MALESDENQVEVTFSKGKYNLSDVEAYIAPLRGTELYESEFLQNSTKTKGKRNCRKSDNAKVRISDYFDSIRFRIQNSG